MQVETNIDSLSDDLSELEFAASWEGPFNSEELAQHASQPFTYSHSCNYTMSQAPKQ